MDGLAVGRLVHYVLKGGRSEGDHRPAIVVRNWVADGSPQNVYPEGYVNLVVFLDGYNDGTPTEVSNYGGTVAWATSVHYSEGLEPGTWHWIEGSPQAKLAPKSELVAAAAVTEPASAEPEGAAETSTTDGGAAGEGSIL